MHFVFHCSILTMFCFIFALFMFFANPKLRVKDEQRVNLKFLVKSGKSPIEAWRELRSVFGDETICKTQVRFWHKRFREGDNETVDKPRSGRPQSRHTAENIETIRGLVQSDARMSLKELSECTGLLTHLIRTVLKKDLQLRRCCAKFIPRTLTEAQQWTRMTVCDDNIKRLCSSDDPEQFLHRIITGDETWVSTYENESKERTTAWVAPNDLRPKKPLRDPVKKTMLTLFFDCKGVVMIEFLKPGDKIDSQTYVKTIAKLKECIRRKRPELWSEKKFILHHDNASPHTSFDTLKKFREWNIDILEHPPYSPDLAPCDFSLFPKLKKELCGRKFPTVKAVQDEARKILMSMLSDIFLDTMHDMVLHWQKCSHVNGDYFEGDHVVVEPLFVKGTDSENSSSDED